MPASRPRGGRDEGRRSMIRRRCGSRVSTRRSAARRLIATGSTPDPRRVTIDSDRPRPGVGTVAGMLAAGDEGKGRIVGRSGHRVSGRAGWRLRSHRVVIEGSCQGTPLRAKPTRADLPVHVGDGLRARYVANRPMAKTPPRVPVVRGRWRAGTGRPRAPRRTSRHPRRADDRLPAIEARCARSPTRGDADAAVVARSAPAVYATSTRTDRPRE